MKTANEDILRKVFIHAEAVDKYCAEHHLKRAFTALYGSQNYGISDLHSDVDTKSLVIPEVTDWLWSTEGNCNHIIILPNNEHAEIKPAVSMFKQFIKGNINFIEILYTPYVDINPQYEWLYQELLNHADQIVSYNKYKQAGVWLGYINQQLCKSMKPCDENQYNPKQFATALRLKESFTRWFYDNMPLNEALNVSDINYLLKSIKEDLFAYDIIQNLAQDMHDWIDVQPGRIKNLYEDIDTFDVTTYFRKLALRIFKEEICG